MSKYFWSWVRRQQFQFQTCKTITSINYEYLNTHTPLGYFVIGNFHWLLLIIFPKRIYKFDKNKISIYKTTSCSHFLSSRFQIGSYILSSLRSSLRFGQMRSIKHFVVLNCLCSETSAAPRVSQSRSGFVQLIVEVEGRVRISWVIVA